MIKYLQNIKYIKGNRSLGIHLKINAENDYTLSAVETVRKKESIEITSKHLVLNSIEDVSEVNKSNAPVSTTITGKGILSRTVQILPDENILKTINTLFPNISFNDFYVQKNLIKENFYHVSIIRKSLLNNILNEFKKYKIFITNLSINPFVIQTILPIINQEELNIPGFSVKIKNNQIQEIESNDRKNTNDNYNVGNEFLESDYLISYACAINYFIDSSADESNLNDLIQSSKEEYLAKQAFTYGGWLVLLSALLILLINYLFYIHYQGKRDELSNKMQLHKNLISQLTEYRTQFQRKTEFLEKNKIQSSSKISYYADQIALSVPSKITLTVLNITPLHKRLKNKHEAEFLFNKILVEGVTPNGIILNQWIKELKKLSWVQKIEITGYSQENINSKGEFTIEIILNTI